MTTTKKNRLTALLISICAAVALLAGATGVMAAKFQITDIDIPEQISIEQGTTEAINVSYTVEGDLPENILQKAAKAASLAWSSSDTAVATVDNCGKLIAVGPGTAEISVSGQNGAVSDSCSVIVTVTPETLTTPDELSLTLNHFDVQNLGAALLPENTTAKVCYESSDESVATVSDTGEVTAIGRGECIILAWAVDSLTGATYDLQSETKVSVQVAPEKLSLSNAILQPGAIKQLPVSMEPAEVDMGTDYTWTSSDESIVTVDETGVVTAKAAGTATITVNNELGQSASCTVTVANAPAKTSTSASGPYNGFVKGEPGVSTAFVRDVNAYYMMVPANVREHFESNGCSVTVSAISVGPRFGWPYSVRAVFDHETLDIWIDYRNVCKQCVIHEMGHYLDQMLGFIANSSEFSSIHANEINSFRSFWSCLSINSATPHEYFAEAYKVCFISPGLMQKYCPQTYAFLMDCSNQL